MVRSKNPHFTPLALCALPLLLVACKGGGQTPFDAGSCVATFSGNFDDVVEAASCGTLAADSAADGGADVSLTFTLDSAVQGAPTHIDIDLGPSPSVGTFSSETVSSWSVLGINTSDCQFSAGSASVPMGSFSLTLTALAAPLEAKEPAQPVGPHGTLTVTQYVQAPPTVDCGAGDTEQIDLDF